MLFNPQRRGGARRAIALEVEGKRYRSIAALARAYGVSEPYVARQYRAGKTGLALVTLPQTARRSA